MRPEIKKIVEQHRKPKTVKQKLAYLQSKERAEQWDREYQAKLQAEEDTVPHENKKEFIRLFKAGGITLGDAARKCGIEDIGVAARILNKQIKPLAHHIEELE